MRSDSADRHFACLARVVIIGFAHHVTERGDGRARAPLGGEGGLGSSAAPGAAVRAATHAYYERVNATPAQAGFKLRRPAGRDHSDFTRVG
jgi:hypothetical protein